MSLINDAIKQANKANKERSPAPGTAGTATAAEMKSADAAIRPATGSMTGMLLIAGIVVFVLLGGSLLFFSIRGTPIPDEMAEPTVSPKPSPQSIAPSATPPQPAAPARPAESPVADALQNPLPPVTPARTPADVSVTPAPTPATQPAEATAAPSPTGPRPFPELKLQGIYYRLNDPSVMINSKTLEIGDYVENVKVIRIERKEVTVELDGQQKVLRLQ